MKFIFDTCDSTQEIAKRMIQSQQIKSKNLYILAKEMTNGKTTKESIKWHSPKGNLYLTIVIDVSQKNENILHLLNFCSSLSMIEALKTLKNDTLNQNIKIKWPNDLILFDNKIAGCMAEKYQNHIIFGMAINLIDSPLKTHNFPAGNLKTLINDLTISENTPELLANLIYENFLNLVEKIETLGFETLKTEIEKYLYKKNETIKLILNNQKVQNGTLISINNNGELVIMNKDSQQIEYSFGEISYR
jgi:BirA family biotin operon repressor/biotin-[acetyl-CoA-carboxylase] ligase